MERVDAGSARDPKRLRLLVLVPLLALVVSCGTHRTPTSYTGSVKKNFNVNCVDQASKGGVSNAKDVCSCTYNRIVKDIPFSRFKKINSQLAEKPQPVPQDLVTIIDACKRSGGESSGTTTSTTSG